MYMNELYPVTVERVGSQPLFDPDDARMKTTDMDPGLREAGAGPGARINITADGQTSTPRTSRSPSSPHEECAVEAAAQLVEQHGGEATVLTLGPAEAEEQLRYAAQPRRGQGGAAADHRRRLGSATHRGGDHRRDRRRSRRPTAPFDLILFGNESADSGGFQVGIRVAHALGRPMVNGSKGIDVDGTSFAPGARADVGVEVVRGSDAGRARREGGHQPAPLPDDEGPAGVEEGRRRVRSRRRASPVASRCHLAAGRPNRSAQTVILGTRPGRGGGSGRRARRDRGAEVSVLVVVEHDRGTMSPATLEALAAARSARRRSHALTIGDAADPLVDQLGAVRRSDRSPGARRPARRLRPRGVGRSRRPGGAPRSRPAIVLATGTDRGNEVMAQAAARLDLPMVANVHRVRRRLAELTRVRWGGSLLETLQPRRRRSDADRRPPRLRPRRGVTGAGDALRRWRSRSIRRSARTFVRDRVERAAGVTLGDRPGGRQRRARRRLGRRLRAAAGARRSARRRRRLLPRP